jgi:hypothetical protein
LNETTSRRSAAPEAPAAPWRAVALPVEHGGWGFLLEPLVLGLVLAPSPAGAALALGAAAAFLARHPFRLALLDRRRGVRYPRTALAERFVAAYLAAALACLAVSFLVARAAFWTVLVVAVPIGLLALGYDARGRSREALPEAAGALALGGSVTAIALAGGMAPGPAWSAWALLGLRAAVSIAYVRARVRLDRGLPAGPGGALAGHGAALAAAAALASRSWAPWLGVVAFAVLSARAAWGLSPRRKAVRPQVLGYQEVGFGILTLVLLAVGYRVGP